MRGPMSRSYNTLPWRARHVAPKGYEGITHPYRQNSAGQPKRGRDGCDCRTGKLWIGGSRSGKHWGRHNRGCGYRGGQVETNVRRRRHDDRLAILDGLADTRDLIDMWDEEWMCANENEELVRWPAQATWALMALFNGASYS